MIQVLDTTQPERTSRDPAVIMTAAARTYGLPPNEVHALHATDLTIDSGEMVVVLGPSGSGKTTMLNLIGGIEQPSEGSLTVVGQALGNLDDEALTTFRRDHVGFIFQFFNLVPTLTARENVELVLELTGGDTSIVEDVLRDVGLSERADHFPGQLSGGEQQRVAIARALAKRPALLLCDEPTGALDLETGQQILSVLQRLHDDLHMTVLMVTHNAAIADMADRVIRMRDGRISDDHRNAQRIAASELQW